MVTVRSAPGIAETVSASWSEETDYAASRWKETPEVARALTAARRAPALLAQAAAELHADWLAVGASAMARCVSSYLAALLERSLTARSSLDAF